MFFNLFIHIARRASPPSPPGLLLLQRLSLVFWIVCINAFAGESPIDQLPSADSLLSASEQSEKTILEQARLSGDLHQLLESFLQLSTIYATQGNAQAIIKQNRKAIALAKKLNDKKAEADLLLDIGSAYGELGNIKEDISHQFTAMALYESLDNQEGIAAALNNIAGSYSDMGNHDKFLEYQNKSLAISKQQNLHDTTALALLNLGQHYADVENNDIVALDYLMQALDILESHSKEPLIYYAFCLTAIASSHFHLNDLESAKHYNRQLKLIAKSHGFEKLLIESALLDAEIALEEKQPQLALQTLEEAEQLTNKLSAEALKTDIYSIRADSYAQLENYQQALHYKDLYSERRINELQDDNRRQILISQAWFDDQEKQKKLDRLQQQKIQQNLQIKEQLFTERALSAGILAATLIVLILLILIYQARKSRSSAVEKSHHLSKAVAQAEKDARRDALTGLLNRRGFMEILEHEYLQMKYNHTHLTLILADIDHFKAINDKYGHECGDKALIKVAGFLKQNIRDEDYISRWGGEEFLIMMPNTDSKAAIHLTERIRKKLSETVFGCAPHQISLTMTFGISQCTRHETVKHCISRADNALYEGKESGRNTVTIIHPG